MHPYSAVAPHLAAWSQHRRNASGNACEPSRSCPRCLRPLWEFQCGPAWLSHGQSPQEAQGEGALAGSLLRVCRREVWIRAGAIEIWGSKHCHTASGNLALISSSNAYWIIHVQLSSAYLLMFLAIPLSLLSRACFIILTLSKAQGGWGQTSKTRAGWEVNYCLQTCWSHSVVAKQRPGEIWAGGSASCLSMFEPWLTCNCVFCPLCCTHTRI